MSSSDRSSPSALFVAKCAAAGVIGLSLASSFLAVGGVGGGEEATMVPGITPRPKLEPLDSVVWMIGRAEDAVLVGRSCWK